MAVHVAGRIIGCMMITGAIAGGAAAVTGLQVALKDGQVVISTAESRVVPVFTTASPTPEPTPTPTVVVTLPPEPEPPKPRPKAKPILKPQVDEYKFIQPQFEGNPDLKQPKGKYEIRLPSNWQERHGSRSQDNNSKFGTSEYSSSRMSKDYQGEMYLFEDGSWIKLEKTNNGVRLTSSPSKADHELRIFTSTSRNMSQNQNDLPVYRQNERSKVFSVPDRVYVFTDLLR
jgi:hypothetical protein